MSTEITIDDKKLSDYIEQEVYDVINSMSLVTENDLIEYTERALRELASKFLAENAFARGHTTGYDEGYQAGFSRGLDIKAMLDSRAKDFEQI